MLDSHYKKGMDIKEGIDLMRRCLVEIKRRYTLAQPGWKIKIISKGGIQVLEDIDNVDFEAVTKAMEGGASVVKDAGDDVEMSGE